MTEVAIVGAVTLPTLLIPSADAAWAGLAVMGPSLTTNFDAASSDGDEIVTVTSKPPATTDIEICESLTPSSVVRAVFCAGTSSSAYVAASTEVSTVRENETS